MKALRAATHAEPSCPLWSFVSFMMNQPKPDPERWRSVGHDPDDPDDPDANFSARPPVPPARFWIKGRPHDPDL